MRVHNNGKHNAVQEKENKQKNLGLIYFVTGLK